MRARDGVGAAGQRGEELDEPSGGSKLAYAPFHLDVLADRAMRIDRDQDGDVGDQIRWSPGPTS
jgi:hypothetical protein